MFVEVGTCIWGLQLFPDRLWIVPTLLAAYFGGHLLQGVGRFRAADRIAPMTLVSALAALAVAMALGAPAFAAGALFVIGYSLGPVIAPAAPMKRSRLAKIGSKLFGMLGAAIVLTGALPFGALAVASAVAYARLASSPSVQTPEPERVGWYSVSRINIFHQSSYFAFVFVFWAIWRDAVSWAPAVFFALGWIGYWAMELSLTAPRAPYRPKLLAAGHLAVALVLGAMASASSPALLMLGWFLTGVGGGTCYTMERAPGGKPSRISDDVGAFFGAATGAGALLLFATPQAALLAGAVYASIAAILALCTISAIEPGSAATCGSSR